jgi:crotonobetainyl-CoA:carnitine CoA-transferase CaiB-like acyl-CoA transferase
VLAARDRPLVLAVGNDRQFAALCTVVGRPELGLDDRFATNPARVAHRDALARELTTALAVQDADAWFTALTAAGVPCGPINDIAEAFDLGQRLGLEPVVDAGGLPSVADPVELSATPVRYHLAPPDVGADAEWLLRYLAERDAAR